MSNKEDEFVDYYSDDDDVGSNNESETTSGLKLKYGNFEFTDNLGMMRVVRMFLYLQILSILIDNPSIHLPVAFTILCRGLLFYSIRFYSRPFMDVIYIAQYFLNTLHKIISHHLPSSPKQGNVKLSSSNLAVILEGNVSVADYSRHLLSNISTGPSNQSFTYPGPKPNFMDPHNWHTITHFMHFFLGILFPVMAFIFTVWFWEIHDYTDRDEVRSWLGNYVADGWWRKGGLRFLSGMIAGCCAMAFIAWFLFALAKEGTSQAIPQERETGVALVAIGTVSGCVWVLGLMGMRSAEQVFVRYVSQNVSYTSTMILKKVVKAKVEVGLALLLLLLGPVLYNLMQTFILMMDWNDNWARLPRKNVNKFVPCYFMSFPPYVEPDMDPNTCPVVGSLAPSDPQVGKSMYKIFTILQCDSHLGILMYVLATVAFGLIGWGYFYFMGTMVQEVMHELAEAKWSENLVALWRIRSVEVEYYENHFDLLSRFKIGVVNEWRFQLRLYRQAFRGFWWSLASVFRDLLLVPLIPLKIVLAPFVFLGKRFILLTCHSLTIEGRRERYRYQKLKELDEVVGEDEVGAEARRNTSLGAEYLMNRIDVAIDDGEVKSLPEIAEEKVISCLRYISPFPVIYRAVMQLWDKFMTTQFATLTRVRSHFMMKMFRRLWNRVMRRNETDLKGIFNKAPWRVARKLSSKTSALREIDRQVAEELDRAKAEFVKDHNLTISVLDRVMDSAGLCMLVAPFRWSRLWWTLIVMVEMCVYAFIGSVSNFYTDWESRVLLIMCTNVAFGVATYLFMPFCEMLDRWLEFFARIMVVWASVGILVCSKIVPGEIAGVHTPMYKPWKSQVYLGNLNPFRAAAYVFIDLLVVGYIYAYLLYVLNVVGVFSVLERKFKSLVGTFHDRILDLLVEKLDERTLGMENMFTGLLLVQQWDDIIIDQRRYALMTWPDVNPANLLTFQEKLLSIKWAALFHLTVPNIRSSLGLTLLHTVMCVGDCESARWIIHKYPMLLGVEDVQRDNPIAIGLKEGAFFLLKYSEQNSGSLHDGTSYGDEAFAEYFPEIDKMRDLFTEFGEFVPEMAETLTLTAKQVKQLADRGHFDEDAKDPKPSFYALKMAGREKANAEQARALVTQGSRRDDDSALSSPSKQQLTKRQMAKRAKLAALQERNSLYAKRFPEDDLHDHFEGGQMTSWRIIGLDIPDVNVYVDQKDEEIAEGHDVQPLDLCKSVKSDAKVAHLKKEFAIPPDHPLMEDIKDWDLIRKKKQIDEETPFTRIANIRSVSMNLEGLVSIAGFGDRPTGEQDRDIRWNLCKFTEIFLSKEIVENYDKITWDPAMFKEWNKMASQLQGRVAQNLALACNFKPPPYFSKMSEWTLGLPISGFHEKEETFEGVDAATRAVVKMAYRFDAAVDTVKAVTTEIKNVFRRRKPKNESENKMMAGSFNDRIIQHLAECVVSSRDVMDLSDCELSVSARYGWRAIVRALRRKYCSFIIPSIFSTAKKVSIRRLELSRNELDDGDAVLVAEVLLYQQTLEVVDLTYNRIGCRGIARMVKLLKGHANIRVFRADHNRIGPAAGKTIGVWLKHTKTLQVLSLSHNRMGDLDRYATLLVRERIPSAARDIFFGLRSNKSLQSLDVSYNHLGPKCGASVPIAVNRHPCLTSLNLSGNAIGPSRGPAMLFALAGEAGGDKIMAARLKIDAERRERERRGLDDEELAKMTKEAAFREAEDIANIRRQKKVKTTKSPPQSPQRGGSSTHVSGGQEPAKKAAAKFVELNIADNQLGAMAGYGVAALFNNNRNLTAMDASGNSLGTSGGVAIARMLERLLGLPSEDPFENAMRAKELDEWHARDPFGNMKYFTNMMYLNVARNGLGPNAMGCLMGCLSSNHCTLTHLDVSDNPLGFSNEKSGQATVGSHEFRKGVATCRVLHRLNFAQTLLRPTELVGILGGMVSNKFLLEINLEENRMDEPCALQLTHAIRMCTSLRKMNLRNCRMGERGSILVVNRIAEALDRFSVLDLTGNSMGPKCGVVIGRILSDASCAVKRLHLSDNDLLELGGCGVAAGLFGNSTVDEIDLSSNQLTPAVADLIGRAVRGEIKYGKTASQCVVTRIDVSNNPGFGTRSAREMVRSFSMGKLEKVNISNIGAGPSTAKVLAGMVRNVLITWIYCDVSGNNFTRSGMNELFWALRVNRSLRVFLCRENKAGPVWGSEDDALLRHGVSLRQLILCNSNIRELDLSFNGLSSGAGSLIFEAMTDNYAIHKLTLRGNTFDDGIAAALGDFLMYNDVVEDLDLGDNRMGYNCCFSFVDGLRVNRSLKVLTVDNNELGNAGTVTVDEFARSLMLNHTLRILAFDGNKLGPVWGARFADVLSRNNSLIKVSLRDNRFDEECGRRLLNAYEHNSRLVELGLTSDEVGGTVWEEFKRVFDKKKAIIAPDDIDEDTFVHEEFDQMVDVYSRHLD